MLKNGFDHFLGSRCFKERKSVKATERDEVKSFRSLETLQAIGHAAIAIPPAALCEDPLIAIGPR